LQIILRYQRVRVDFEIWYEVNKLKLVEYKRDHRVFVVVEIYIQVLEFGRLCFFLNYLHFSICDVFFLFFD